MPKGSDMAGQNVEESAHACHVSQFFACKEPEVGLDAVDRTQTANQSSFGICQKAWQDSHA
jgi:hypothetical protein